MNKIILFVFTLFSSWVIAQKGEIYGTVTDTQGNLLSNIKVEVLNSDMSSTTVDGKYHLELEGGNYTLQFQSDDLYQEIIEVKIKAGQRIRRDIILDDVISLEGLELFGSINKQPEKLDLITRLPLKPNENIQSITTISNQLIEKQGVLTLTDAVRNVPGVYTYATYGGKGESISARGFRGIPVLKNGVRVHSDFRGIGFVTDMQGVESIQVIKGASTISQGFGLDLGSAGGVVNLVTKVPDFKNFGKIDLRYGSWNQIRPTIDLNTVLNKEENLAFRLNGAYEHSDGYRDNNNNNRYYINPSLRWKPSDRLDIKLEMDYLDDKNTPDPGTVNLSKDNTENLLYDLPKEKYLGFKDNEYASKVLTYSATLKYDLSNQLYLKGGFYGSRFESKGMTTTLRQKTNDKGIIENPNIVRRGIAKSPWKTDENQIGQLDVVLHHIQTGDFKHLMQIGADVRTTQVESQSFTTFNVDEIDIFSKDIPNTLNKEASFKETGNSDEDNTQWGAMAQYVVEYKNWARLFAGVRYSNYENEATNGRLNKKSNVIEYSKSSESDHTWNPIFGLMVYPKKQLALFASYTNTSNPRNATKIDEKGNQLGNETSNQYEVGFKSEWFGNRLRFNTTYYRVENKNMIMQDAALNNKGNLEFLPWYVKGGDDTRQGVELEVIGRITQDWELMMGYSWINAEYKNSTRFVDGSSPNNTPKNVANLWTNYTFSKGSLDGFNIGAGLYYIGERPYNDYVFTEYHGIQPGLKPWNVEGYTTVNAQLGYTAERYHITLFFNNIFDEIGYNVYRNMFINRINPRNFAIQVGYNF